MNENKKLYLLKSSLNPLLNFLVFLLILFMPTQLGKHFWINLKLSYGIRIDYLSFTVYLTDILTFFLFCTFFLKYKGKIIKRLLIWFDKSKSFYVVFTYVVLNIFLALNPLVSFLKWLKIFELVFLVLFFSQYPRLKIDKVIIKPLSLSLIFVSVLGILQFVKQSSLNGLFYFFGERTFSAITPGIALTNLWGREYLRAYSSFSHPNSFAGYLGVGASLLWLLSKKKRIFSNFFLGVTFTLIFLALGLTFSRSVMFTLFLVIILTFFQRNRYFPKLVKFIFVSVFLLSFISLFIPDKSYTFSKYLGFESVRERALFLNESQEIFFKSPIIGIGLNNYLLVKKEAIVPYKIKYLYQPVHNIYLLVLTEGGIVGLVIFYILIKKLVDYSVVKKANSFILIIIFILITGFVDHYWLTLQQNLLLLSLVFGLNFRKDIG